MAIVLLDHVAVAVADLSAAEREWTRLGFAVTAGGQHRDRGTANVLVPFAGSYLELISVTDHEVAMRAGRAVLIERLRARGDGPLAYAVRGEDFDRVARGAQVAGLTTGQPVAVSRSVPGGGLAAWRLLSPNHEHYATWWPFFIEWERGYPAAPADGHPNLVTGVDEVLVGVGDLDRARRFFESGFGIEPSPDRPGDGSSARAVSYDLGNARLTLLPDASTGHAGQRDDGVRAVVVTAPEGRSPLLLPEAPTDPAALMALPPAVSGLRLAVRYPA